jgi:hypothetical protein
VEVATGKLIATSGVDGRAEQFGLLIDRLTQQLVGDGSGSQGHLSSGQESENDVKIIARIGDAVSAYDLGDIDGALAILGPICRERPDLTPVRALYECITKGHTDHNHPVGSP